MYQVIKLSNGERRSVITTPSMTQARERATHNSAHNPRTLYMIVRSGFGDAILFAYNGELLKPGKAAELLSGEIERMAVVIKDYRQRSGDTVQNVAPSVCARCEKETDLAVVGPDGTYCIPCHYERMTASELRDIAERSDLDHDGLSKSELVSLLVQHAHPGPTHDRKIGPSEHKNRPEDRTIKTNGIAGAYKIVDASEGIVEAVVNVFGVIDEGDDIVHPGAFTKTLSEHAGRVRVLDNHNMFSTSDVIGFPLEMREIGRDDLPPSVLSKYPEATGGLLVKMQFRMNTERGRDTFDLIKMGQLEYSIGFDILQADMSKVVKSADGTYKPCYENDNPNLVKNDSGRALVVRNIRQIRLWDVSPVVWGMNPATATVSAKDASGPSAEKTVSGATDLPLAPRERDWNSDRAVARMRQWAGGPDKDEIDWAKYRKGFFWYDSDASETFTAYKLPFGDVIDGELHAVPRGIFAVAGVLEGARGGADIPDDDMGTIRDKVSRYYSRMADEFDDDQIAPPWEGESNSADGPDSTESNINVQMMKAYGKLETAARDLLAAIEAVTEMHTKLSQRAAEDPTNAPTPGNETEAGPQGDVAPERERLLSRINDFLGEDNHEPHEGMVGPG